MIQVPDAVKQGWALRQPRKATSSDVALLEPQLGAKLPASYIDFIREYGFVEFGDDDGRTCVFDWSIEGQAQREVRQGEIAFLRDPERALKAGRIATDTNRRSSPRPSTTSSTACGQTRCSVAVACRRR